MHLLATIPHPVLPSLQVVSRDAAVVGELRLNDPILDGTVSVTALGDASVARALLSQDGTREDLLVVVKGHPGGKVDCEHVYLPIPAVSFEGVSQAVSDAVALARSLSDATQRPREDGERAAQAARQTVTS